MNASGLRYDVSPLGPSKKPWVAKVGGLPLFIRAIAHALIRHGHGESEAVQLAVGAVQRWASGQGHVTEKTRTKAAAALAEWEAKKAASHARRDAAPVTEGGSAGLLLPKGNPPALVEAAEAAQRHRFTPSADTPRRCATCGQPASAPAHRRPRAKGDRHAGPDHQHRPSGHAPSITRLRKRTRDQVEAHAATLEPQATDVMRALFAKQAKATIDRLHGRRGKTMLRAAQQPPEGEPPAQPVDASNVFDLAHWMAETRAAMNPVYAAVTALTQQRMADDLHAGQPYFTDAVDAAKAALADRGSKLADTVSRTTFADIQAALSEGVANGEGISGLTRRVQQVFDDASRVRAEMIARTEVIGGLNTAADAYAAALPAGIVARKEWLATPDSRTRETHREANGQRRNVGEPFMVGGFPMAHPGDPAAPPDEVINCRCTTVYVPAYMAAQAAQPVANVA